MSESRPNAGQFRKGQSGNPGGRAKLSEEFKTKCRDLTPKVLEAWANELESRGDNWLKASELIAAYGHGKPTQPVEVSPLDELSDEQLKARYDALVASGSATSTEPGE